MLTVAFLRKQEIRLPRGGQIGHSVSGVQQNRALTVGQGCIGLDLKRLVVTEMAAHLLLAKPGLFENAGARVGEELPVIMVFDLPAAFGVDILAIPALDVVGNNGEVARVRLVSQ